MNILKLIPFIIASGLVTLNIGQTLAKPTLFGSHGEQYQYIVEDSVWFAAIGLAITWILFLLKQRYWVYIFLALTILSFTSLIQFSNFAFIFGIGPLKIELISLTLFFAHIRLNPEIISDLRQNEEKAKEQAKTKFESSVERFMGKFSSKSSAELESIANEPDRIPEAQEAARRLLKEKKG